MSDRTGLVVRILGVLLVALAALPLWADCEFCRERIPPDPPLIYDEDCIADPTGEWGSCYEIVIAWEGGEPLADQCQVHPASYCPEEGDGGGAGGGPGGGSGGGGENDGECVIEFGVCPPECAMCEW